MFLLFLCVYWDTYLKKIALIFLNKNERYSVGMYMTESYIIYNEKKSVKKGDIFYFGKHCAKKKRSIINLLKITLNSFV